MRGLAGCLLWLVIVSPVAAQPDPDKLLTTGNPQPGRCGCNGISHPAGARLTVCRVVLRGADGTLAWAELEVGRALKLEREPGSRHDARAIAIHSAQGYKLGFLPRAENEPIAALMDAGRAVRAIIVEVIDGRHGKTGALQFRQPLYRVELLS